MDFIQLLKDNIPGFNVAEFNSEWEVGTVESDEESSSSSSENETEDEEDDESDTSDVLDECIAGDAADAIDGMTPVDAMLSEFDNCKCPKPDSSWKCLQNIPRSLLSKLTKQFHDKNTKVRRETKRSYVSGLLHTLLRISSDVTDSSGNPLPGQIRRSAGNFITSYYLYTKKVCKNGFMYALQISQKLIENILYTLETEEDLGLAKEEYRNPRLNTGTKNMLTEIFLRKIAELRGTQSPSAVRSRKKGPNRPFIFLPRGTVKKELHEELVNCLDEAGLNITITRSWFYRVWKRNCNDIRILKRGSDYCDFCTKHLMDAKECEISKLAMDAHKALVAQERSNFVAQCNDPNVLHLSFDFAQSIQLPRFLRQPGSYYFKSGMNVRIFGVCCETKKTQMNYLIPEGFYPGSSRSSGKDPNLVLNLVFHYLEHYCTHKNIRFHADSCAGQKKNQFVFKFIIWLVICGRLDSATLSFLPPGHTKGIVDGNFGSGKSKANTMFR